MRRFRLTGSMISMCLAVVAFVAVPAKAGAQETGTITGTVVDSATVPLTGVQVSIPGLGLGVLTNAEGAFRIQNVPVGSQIVHAQRIGYEIQELEVAVTEDEAATADFQLTQTAVELDDVVVTALGISREERALGYSVQDVAGSDLDDARETNIVNSLAGKVSGVQISERGPLGGSASIIIRGSSSISGDNQPLFVVDGVPIDNSAEGGEGAPDYGNAAQDINPENIESVSVLKGANAAALYGSRAANGVVLITTKTGAGAGERVDFSASNTTTFLTPLKMPVYQNEWGGGSEPSGFKFTEGTGGAGGINDGVDESWGPALNGTEYQQWDPDSPTGASMQPFLARPYSVRDYWDVGRTTTTNLSAAASTDRARGRLSFTRMDANGMQPTMTLDRTTLFLNAGVDVTPGLTVSGSGTYTNSSGGNRNYGGGSGLYSNTYAFAWWQRQTSMRELERAVGLWENGEGRWPEGHPGYGKPDNWNHNYWDNIYWLADYAWNEDSRDRLTGHIQVDYQINGWLSSQLRSGTDWYEFAYKRAYPVNAIDDPFGGFTDVSNFRQETDTQLLLTGQGGLTSDLRLSVTGGANHRSNKSDRRELDIERLNVPDIYNPSNSAVPPLADYEVERKKVYSAFVMTSLSFRDYLFLDVTGRNDWSSSLPEDNNSYFYPSVSTSFVFSDVLDVGRFLDFGKIRASWAEVGSDADPYQLTSVFQGEEAWQGIPSLSPSTTIPATGLRPEITSSWEAGAELRFAGGWGLLDFTYYNSSTRDQIIPVPISKSSGFETRILNAGEIQNKGVEVRLTADVLRNSPLRWSVTTNWSTNDSKVVSLHEDLETVVLGTYGRSDLSVEARRGEPYGVFYGTDFKRNEAGEILVDAAGRPEKTESKERLGVATPDWLAGIRNDFQYRDLTVSFLLDWRYGGKVYCGTCQLERRTGLLEETANRPDGGILIEGVKPDGSPNDVALDPRTYWGSSGVYGIDTMHLNDASFVKLREVKLGFAVPDKFIRGLPISGAQIQLVGRNLALWSDVPHIDPEVDVLRAYGGAPLGIEYLQEPSARSFGINVNLTR